MTTLPDKITRYTGANCFTAEDSAGNIFYAFQKQNDAGCVVIVRPDGSSKEVLSIPSGGRPSLECNPFVNLWAVGNKEVPTNQTPPRYPIKEYVPFPIVKGDKGDPGPPGAGGIQLFPEPRRADAWHARAMAANEGILVNIPAVFAIPPARIYKVRLSVQASIAGVTARVGTFAAPYFLTQTTQAPGIRIDTQGDVPGESTWVSCVGGACLVWLQIVG